MSVGVAIMAKAPRAGLSKTRLMSLLSGEEAAALSGAFLRDVTQNLADAAPSRAVPYVAYAPAGAEALFDGLLAPGTRLLLADGQCGAPPGVQGFGRCLLHAMQALFERGHSAACVLNADSPTLPARLLRQAVALLEQPGHRAVMGPAEDGGYYLLGARLPSASLFAGIEWSTDRVAGQTRQRALADGLEFLELDPWYDVDEPAALVRVMRELASPGDCYPAPATAACVTRLDLAARLALEPTLCP